jgi:hypothetical protein
VAFFFPKKLQNVMAVTDCLPCSGNLDTTKKGATAMIPVILALAFLGTVLTTAFGLGVLPL